eukprot:5680535-Prymnesium_polylepis.1
MVRVATGLRLVRCKPLSRKRLLYTESITLYSKKLGYDEHRSQGAGRSDISNRARSTSSKITILSFHGCHDHADPFLTAAPRSVGIIFGEQGSVWIRFAVEQRQLVQDRPRQLRRQRVRPEGHGVHRAIVRNAERAVP